MSDSNFSFLSQHWGFLLDDARQVEGYALRDARAAAIYARRTLELVRSINNNANVVCDKCVTP